MSAFETGVSITVFTLVLVGCILLVTLWIVQRVAQRQTRAAWVKFPNAAAVLLANFIGQESVRGIQVRGSGVLVITPDELVFEKWMSSTDYRIPIRAIESVETVKNFQGKLSVTPMLKVSYRGDGGARDAIGWSLRDADGLKQQIEALIRSEDR